MSIKDRLGAFSEFIETRLQRAKESNGEDEMNPMYIQATDVRLSKKQPPDSVHVDITYEKETFKDRVLG